MGLLDRFLHGDAPAEPDPDPVPPPPVPPAAVYPPTATRVQWRPVRRDTDNPDGWAPWGRLITARAGGATPMGVLMGIGTGTVTYDLDDPCSFTMFRLDGAPATSADIGVEIQQWRNGRMIPGCWFTIKGHTIDEVAGTGTLTIANSEQLIADRVQGNANRLNYADVVHWDPMADTAGHFDSALTGWTPRNCTQTPVLGPSIDEDAPWTMMLTAPPGGVVDPDCGSSRIVDVSHSFPGGITYRLGMWNWMPTGGTGSGFAEGAALRARYLPPGVDHWDETTALGNGSIEAVKVVDIDHPRGRPVHLFVDILVPPNSGGQVELFPMPAEGSPDNPGGPLATYWLSRWNLIRDDTFTAVNYLRGDRVASVPPRIIDDMSYPGDDPYRSLIGSGPPTDTADGVPSFEPLNPLPGLRRVLYRFEEVVHANDWSDIIVALHRDGGVHIWLDCGPTQRILRTGLRGRIQPSYRIMVDGPRGRPSTLDPDATQARGRLIVQSKESDFSRPEGVAFGANLPQGAMVDEVVSADTDDANVYRVARDRMATRQNTPNRIQVVLPGDAAHEVQPGDTFPVRLVHAGHVMQSTPTHWWVCTAPTYDEATDTVLAELTDMVPA